MRRRRPLSPLAAAIARPRRAHVQRLGAGRRAAPRLCAAEFVHVYPSRAQLMDGLVQFVVSRKWRDLLVFARPLAAADAATTAPSSIRRKNSARASSPTSISSPAPIPRDREQNDPALLSAINRDFDVVFVADDAFDFARTVPYHLARPRPVIGSIDLEPVAWHWTWERNGAPQVELALRQEVRRPPHGRRATGPPGSRSR